MTKMRPVQRHYFAALAGEHPAYLMITAFRQREFRFTGTENFQRRRSARIFFILQQQRAAGEERDQLGRQIFIHRRAVDFWHFVFRRSQPVDEFALIGEEEQAARVFVEAADGGDLRIALPPARWEQIVDARAFAAFVRTDKAGGFVHQQQNAFQPVERFAIDAHGCGIDFVAEVVGHFSRDGYAAARDPHPRLTAGAVTKVGEQLIETAHGVLAAKEPVGLKEILRSLRFLRPNPILARILSVLRISLFSLSFLAVVLAVLNYVRAPEGRLWWKTALVVGEFGHWLVLLPLGVAGLALFTATGSGRTLILLLCLLACVGFLRPAYSAARLLPGTFSWCRLYWPAKISVVPVQSVIYSRPAGQELLMDIYEPPFAQDSSARRPCLLVIHGGGWDSGDNSQLPEWNHRWAGRGWVVAALNYRLAPAHPWPAQRDDVHAAVAWLKANAAKFGLDEKRIVLLARSAGGQIATAVAYGSHDSAIRGVIALYAPHDMKFAWGVSREDDTLNSIKLMRQYLGGPPDTPERIARYESASGQLLAVKNSPPTLLIHGYPDTLVWHRHSRRLAAQLSEHGVVHTHIELPWAVHAFDYNPDGPGGQVTDHAIRVFLDNIAR